MIVYQSTKAAFLDNTFKHDIEDVILDAYRKRTGRRVSPAEIRSWKSSLVEMAKVLNDDIIPEDCGVAIEYGIPQTSKRIDVLVSGLDADGRGNLMIVELKQWESAEATDRDGIVRTRFAGGEADTSHPSYQAWSYAELLRNFNETVYTENIPLHPCAYLHNFANGKELLSPSYADYLRAAPIFLKGDQERANLRRFIARHLRRGDGGDLIVQVDNGRIRPSRHLVDTLQGMLSGNREFVLVDDQKVVYETALSIASMPEGSPKKVVIVDGGPGTGKSVVAINLLVELTSRRLLTKYVTKNAAPRDVFEKKLSGTIRKSKIAALFSGSGEFINTPENQFDALVVDEAHRLNEKSGLYGNLGENQIRELLRASRTTVFFIDEDQRVTWKDIGKKGEIEAWAQRMKAEVTHLKLESQFRCSGSDGYLAWLDNALGIRQTANEILDPTEYRLQVMDSPNEVRATIERLNAERNRARLVAGYCWDWKSKKDPGAMDVVIPEHGFAMQWNLAVESTLWIIGEGTVRQIGCIHTCQGLELDYVGVIIGPDLIVRDGEVITRPEMRSRHDHSIKGYKKALKENPGAARSKADSIIKNTYRTLMTRGMKGCFIYCTDPETADYFRERIGDAPAANVSLKAAEDPASY